MSFGLLQGKVVAITGCSTGIGRAIAIGKPFRFTHLETYTS